MAKLVTTPGEGVVLAICKIFPFKFGNTKMAFDTLLVIIAVVTVLSFLGHLEGVREGTIAGAVFVGLLTKKFSKPLKALEEKYLYFCEAYPKDKNFDEVHSVYDGKS